ALPARQERSSRMRVARAAPDRNQKLDVSSWVHEFNGNIDANAIPCHASSFRVLDGSVFASADHEPWSPSEEANRFGREAERWRARCSMKKSDAAEGHVSKARA